MPKFLTTEGISYHLMQIIRNAEERLILISPFLQINELIKKEIDIKKEEGIDIIIVYGKGKKKTEQTEVKYCYWEPIHAKCFLNEKEAIITSMNLYDFSQSNNYEMGILVSKEEDSNLYTDIYKEARNLVKKGIKIELPDIKENKLKKNVKKLLAYCIHCKKEIKLNKNRPYCKDCYISWNKDKNNKEKCCHLCRKTLKSSLNKPVCLTCYKENKEMFKTT